MDLQSQCPSAIKPSESMVSMQGRLNQQNFMNESVYFEEIKSNNCQSPRISNQQSIHMVKLQDNQYKGEPDQKVNLNDTLKSENLSGLGKPSDKSELKTSSEKVPCHRCDGSKLNRKGKKCKKCQGTGLMSNKFLQSIYKSIVEEV
jgi:DnaJ-class molecular chaperone